jgi:hypothetical protein
MRRDVARVGRMARQLWTAESTCMPVRPDRVCARREELRYIAVPALEEGHTVLLKMVAHTLAFAVLLGLLLFLPRERWLGPKRGCSWPFSSEAAKLSGYGSGRAIQTYLRKE